MHGAYKNRSGQIMSAQKDEPEHDETSKSSAESHVKTLNPVSTGN